MGIESKRSTAKNTNPILTEPYCANMAIIKGPIQEEPLSVRANKEKNKVSLFEGISCEYKTLEKDCKAPTSNPYKVAQMNNSHLLVNPIRPYKGIRDIKDIKRINMNLVERFSFL